MVIHRVWYAGHLGQNDYTCHMCATTDNHLLPTNKSQLPVIVSDTMLRYSGTLPDQSEKYFVLRKKMNP